MTENKTNKNSDHNSLEKKYSKGEKRYSSFFIQLNMEGQNQVKKKDQNNPSWHDKLVTRVIKVR